MEEPRRVQPGPSPLGSAHGAGERRARRGHRRWPWIVLAGVLTIALGITVWVGLRLQHAVDSATQGRGGSAMDLLVAKPLNGEGKGRVNILLAGNSFDEKGHEGAALTDSVMVASMDLSTHKVALISIPRDLWVEYGGQGMKINAVYPTAASGTAGAATLGDHDKGMRALAGVTEGVTGLAIDQYALVGYQALKDVVDAVGGVDVFIDSPDPRGIYDPAAGLQIGNGLQHIDGLTALRLSRARNDKQVEGNEGSYGVPDNDFGRTRNQRKVMDALMTKAKTTPALANPASMVSIFDTISVNVRTDLSAAQARRIYDLTGHSGGLTSLTVKGDATHDLLEDYTSEKRGAYDALIPTAGRNDYSEIKAYLAGKLKG